MSQEIVTQQIQQEIEKTLAAIDRLQSKWPSGISLDLGRKKIYYDCLPYLFLAAFPSLTYTQIRPFNLAIKLLASSLFVYDKLMDRQDRDCSIESGLRVQVMQFESYQQFHRLFDPESIFWRQFQKYIAEYADACLQEQAFQSGQRPWSEYTETLALEIASGKSGVAKVTIVGLVELSGDNRWLEALTRSVDYYNIAFQMLDDLEDWKEDLSAGVPSLLTSRLVDRSMQATPNELALQLDRLSRKLYYERHAEYVLKIAIESLDRASKSIEQIPELGWLLEISRLRQHCQSLSDDIYQIIKSNLQRARQEQL